MQGTAQDWPESVKRLPAHCSFKALDRPDLFATAKAIKPDIFTILRLWDDSLQHYDGNTIDYGRVKAIFENPKPKSQGGHNYGFISGSDIRTPMNQFTPTCRLSAQS